MEHPDNKAIEPLLATLTNRQAVSDLIDAYATSLDRGVFDQAWASALFTEDISLRYPVGSHEGREGVIEFTREIMERWDRTQHLTTNHLVDLGEDRAEVSWNLLATHLHPADDPARAGLATFRVGGRFEGVAVRNPEGWLFSRLSLRIIWTDGSPATGVPASAVETNTSH